MRNQPLTGVDFDEAARTLRAVVAAVERGELDAPAGMVAYLSGAADTASVVAERMISAPRP